MTLMSIPFSDPLTDWIVQKAAMFQLSRADIVRQAVIKMREDDFWSEIKQAKQEYKEGKFFEGDFRTALKQYQTLHGN